jgi:transposase-like protein
MPRRINAQRYERGASRYTRRPPRARPADQGWRDTVEGSERQQAFETAIIERYRRRESSVEEALIEMYLGARTAWSTKRYLNIELLKHQQMRDAITA